MNYLHFAAAFGKPQAVLSKETLAEKIASTKGEVIELSARGSQRSSSGEPQNPHIMYFFFCKIELKPKDHYRDNTEKESGHRRSTASRVGSINNSDPNRKRGMVLPFEPLSIAFDDIRYAIDMPQVLLGCFCSDN